MTCIVGIAHKGKVYLGGDSAGVSGLDVVVRKDKKVFKNSEFVMGFTSSFRMGQILQYTFTPPEVTNEDDDLMAYMVQKFIPALRKAFKEEGYTSIESNREKGGCFLVGVRGRLFQIDSDFQVGEHINNIAAVGCGEAYAYGSLYAQKGNKATSEEKIEAALECAAFFSGGVVAPFNLVHT